MVNHDPSFEKKIFNYFDFKYNVLDGEWYAVAKRKVGLKLIINIDEIISLLILPRLILSCG